ncbi:hypothetical protein [uncultured Aquimarina sp.]|uniref:hypothetical protein n=1 Tax=uncultured Aquimarina sp. TaxID=575652 RepID=UPI0026311A97|nr:hypothetical protein [uncultured Aquimarina sp.]
MNYKIIFSLSILLNIPTIYGQNNGEQHKSTKLEESFNQNDEIINEYLLDELRPIRESFKKINSTTNWTEIKEKELRETTEGGEAKFYYLKDDLSKIVTIQFGKTFQKLTEYYLSDNGLSFVFEKSYKDNRPIYYDSKTKEENNDTEEFDFEKSEIIEERSYFKSNKLIHQLNNQDCGSPFPLDYLLKEEKRIITNFQSLMKIK